MVEFSKIRMVEFMKGNGKLEWLYTAHATSKGKHLGFVYGDTEKKCQDAIDKAKANPDEFISQSMFRGER